jgi:glycine amidinotransferase
MRDEGDVLEAEETADPHSDSEPDSQSTKSGAKSGAKSCAVNSYNEWDPLEEVIVGRLDDATIPGYHVTIKSTIPPSLVKVQRWFGGIRYPQFMVKPAQKELDEFINILKAEGVRVRRPDRLNGKARFGSPTWKSRGYCISCPRDGFLVIGDEIIETPMAWRSRFYEAYAYRSLFKEYFNTGARWTSAPKPELTDDLYNHDYRMPEKDEPVTFVINEFEPVFDAADFVRCGRDIFGMLSNVTNRFGIEWLQRHLGDDYRIHIIENRARQPMHIDSSFMPLAPGKVLVNPDYIDIAKLPPVLKSWDILEAPRPDPAEGFVNKVSMCSAWISLNVLMLDEKRVIVDKSQISMIKALKDWGFEPIPCAFLHYAPLGGAFHCATLDVRRRGGLQSYF